MREYPLQRLNLSALNSSPIGLSQKLLQNQVLTNLHQFFHESIIIYKYYDNVHVHCDEGADRPFFHSSEERYDVIESMPEILLVEDSKHDVEFILDALKKHDLTDKIKVFHDGVDVLDYIFATGKYSGCDTCKKLRVIILDLKLPKVDGLDVLQGIRASEKTRMIPVVVFSSSTENRDRIESYRLGANSYIVKPVSYENFVNTAAEIGSYWMLHNVPA